MKLKTTILMSVASFAIASTAQAGDIYGAIGAGLSYVQPDRDFETDTVGSEFDGDIDYDKGVGIYVALGKHLASDWRAEIEYANRDNDARHVSGQSPGFPGFGAIHGFDGELTAHSVMFNLIKDFKTQDAIGGVTPYLGGGVGFSILDLDLTTAGVPAGLDTLTGVETRLTPSYQGIAGLAFDVAENLVLDVSYRFTGSAKSTFDAVYNGSPIELRTNNDTHSVFAGLRWNFGGSGAVEYKDCWDGSSVPVSAECPPQLVEQQAATPDDLGVIVYFDYDKSNLTPEASTLIREFSAQALSNDINTVVVSGNTDTSGSSAYNEALSQRRASAVREALIANGVPAEKVETRAFGESNLAKPTADGTREPLNRRAEVVISFE